MFFSNLKLVTYLIFKQVLLSSCDIFKFIYGWSNLGNTQVVIGKLDDAESSYSTAIDLCKENLDKVGDQFGVRRCDDLYLLYLNRGCLRLNNNMKKVRAHFLNVIDICFNCMKVEMNFDPFSFKSLFYL